MKLYYRPKDSGRPMRVAWLLEELGVDYEAVAIEDTDSSEHRERHPLGRVPVLEFDDGSLLFDSTAILLAIADRHPESGFLAAPGSRERDLVYQWSLTAMTELEKAALGYVMDEDEDSVDLFRTTATALSDALGDRDFLVGETMTVADLVVVGVLIIAERGKLVTDEASEALQRYFHRLGGRPTLVRAAQRVESLLQPDPA